MPLAISPHHTLEELLANNTLEKKIEIYEDQIEGWQINIARECAKIPHSGFGVLSIITSYFENIAKCYDGYIGIKSKYYFKKGFHMVFPDLNKHDQSVVDKVLELLYCKVRCGLYHQSITGAGIGINEENKTPISFTINSSAAIISPSKLVEAVNVHFRNFIADLRNPMNTKVRINFENYFAKRG